MEQVIKFEKSSCIIFDGTSKKDPSGYRQKGYWVLKLPDRLIAVKIDHPNDAFKILAASLVGRGFNLEQAISQAHSYFYGEKMQFRAYVADADRGGVGVNCFMAETEEGLSKIIDAVSDGKGHYKESFASFLAREQIVGTYYTQFIAGFPCHSHAAGVYSNENKTITCVTALHIWHYKTDYNLLKNFADVLARNVVHYLPIFLKGDSLHSENLLRLQGFKQWFIKQELLYASGEIKAVDVYGSSIMAYLRSKEFRGAILDIIEYFEI